MRPLDNNLPDLQQKTICRLIRENADLSWQLREYQENTRERAGYILQDALHIINAGRNRQHQGEV